MLRDYKLSLTLVALILIGYTFILLMNKRAPAPAAALIKASPNAVAEEVSSTTTTASH